MGPLKGTKTFWRNGPFPGQRTSRCVARRCPGRVAPASPPGHLAPLVDAVGMQVERPYSENPKSRVLQNPERCELQHDVIGGKFHIWPHVAGHVQNAVKIVSNVILGWCMQAQGVSCLALGHPTQGYLILHIYIYLYIYICKYSKIQKNLKIWNNSGPRHVRDYSLLDKVGICEFRPT